MTELWGLGTLPAKSRGAVHHGFVPQANSFPGSSPEVGTATVCGLGIPGMAGTKDTDLTSLC